MYIGEEELKSGKLFSASSIYPKKDKFNNRKALLLYQKSLNAMQSKRLKADSLRNYKDDLEMEEGNCMNKPLSEMSLEELWKLFPILLTEHKAYWEDWYQLEKANLLPALPDTVIIHHIGSTSIKGIWAKPTIDILVEANLNDYDAIKSLLLQNGYTCMAQTETRIDFNKGYTPEGFAEKVFHLHLRTFGDNDELYFRDYLNEHPEIAKAYEKLKRSLWKQFEHNRDGYTESKTAFVREYTQKAILQYGRIYG